MITVSYSVIIYSLLVVCVIFIWPSYNYLLNFSCSLYYICGYLQVPYHGMSLVSPSYESNNPLYIFRTSHILRKYKYMFLHRMPFVCPYYVLYMSFIRPSYVLNMSFTCRSYVLNMSFTCRSYVLRMSLICPLHVVHTSLICPLHVVHTSFVCP